MKWVTREGAKTDRVACPWLIRKFIDPQAVFLFMPKDVGIVPEAAGLQAAAHGFAAICADDHRTRELEFPMYDALYAWCQAKAAGRAI
jgi:hypothetical protein